MSDEKPLNPAAERAIVNVRRLMMIASGTTFLAVAAVLVVIGYRVFRMGESAPAPAAEIPAALPAGAKVLSSAVGEGRIVLTIDVGGAIELRSFDLNALKPLGRLRLSPRP
jgi:tellurite resistance protein TehA-like permease